MGSIPTRGNKIFLRSAIDGNVGICMKFIKTETFAIYISIEKKFSRKGEDNSHIYQTYISRLNYFLT